jgi:hypothetical protein
LSSVSFGTLISIHLPEKLPSCAGGAGGRRTPRQRAYTQGHVCGHTAVGGFASANATGLVPGRCVNHACAGSFETRVVSS